MGNEAKIIATVRSQLKAIQSWGMKSAAEVNKSFCVEREHRAFCTAGQQVNLVFTATIDELYWAWHILLLKRYAPGEDPIFAVLTIVLTS